MAPTIKRSVSLLALLLCVVSPCLGSIRVACLTSLVNVTLFDPTTNTSTTTFSFDSAYEREDFGTGVFQNSSGEVDNVEDFVLPDRFVVPTLFDSNTRVGFDDAEDHTEIGIVGLADLGGSVDSGEDGTSVLNDRVFSTPLIAGINESATNYSGLTPFIVAGFGDVDRIVKTLTPFNLSSLFIDVSTLGNSVEKADFLQAARTLANLNDLKVVALAVTEEDVAIAADASVDLISEMPTEVLSNATLNALSNNNVFVATTLNVGNNAAVNAKETNFDLMLDFDVDMVFGSGYGSLVSTTNGVANVTLGELSRITSLLTAASNATAAEELYRIITLNPSQLWNAVLRSPFYVGGEPQIGSGASFYLEDGNYGYDYDAWEFRLTYVAPKRKSKDPVQVVAYGKGNIPEDGCTRRFCPQCTLGYEERDVESDVERIVAIVVPTMFIAIMYLCVSCGVMYHFVVRNNALQVPPTSKIIEVRFATSVEDAARTLL